MKKILSMLLVACVMAFSGCEKDDSVSGQGESSGEVETKDCFYFEAVNGIAVVSMYKGGKDELSGEYEYGMPPEVSLEYSLNKGNWKPFVVGETDVALHNAGDRVYIRATDVNESFCKLVEDEQGNRHFINNYFGTYKGNGSVKVGGNIMYLLDGTGSKKEFDTSLNKYAFYELFCGMLLTDASELVLPATTLACGCYARLFDDCMLTAAPVLPATKLAEECYDNMFHRNTKLKSVEVGFTDWESSATNDWMAGVSSTGTFICPEGLDVSRRDESHVPEGWTIVRK